MSYNTFGRHFRITSYGESHGSHIGVVIDGCPAGILIDESKLQMEMQRRRPGQSALATPRNENDLASITSGIYDGVSTGAPIHIMIPNNQARSKDYDHLKSVYRPSHADYTYQTKYGLRDHRGGGRSSARETACRVAAGAIAKQLIAAHDITVLAYTHQIGSIAADSLSLLTLATIESSKVRCPDPLASERMEAYILKCKEEGDTCGGIIQAEITGVQAGLGEPIYNKLEARLAFAMLSINACTGFDYGSGFAGSTLLGSENNDAFSVDENRKVNTKSNRSGGIQGGISNGESILFRTAFKPVSSIKMEQSMLSSDREEVIVAIQGRHDPCVVPRAVPIVEAMAALVMADLILGRRLDQMKTK